MPSFFFSEDGQRCCIDNMYATRPLSKRSLLFCESERTQLDDVDAERGHKIFWSELEAMTGDSLVAIDKEFISNTKIANSKHSARAPHRSRWLRQSPTSGSDFPRPSISMSIPSCCVTLPVDSVPLYDDSFTNAT